MPCERTDSGLSCRVGRPGGSPWKAAAEDMLTMTPPAGEHIGMACFMVSTYPRRLTVMVRSQISRSISTTSVSPRSVLMSAPTLNSRSTPP